VAVSPGLRTRLGVGAAAIVLASFGVITAPLIPGPVHAEITRVGGAGPAVTTAFSMPDGWSLITWDVADIQQPVNGCVFGLRLLWLDQPVDGYKEAGRLERFRGGLPKLDYRSIAAGSRRTATYGPVELKAGIYQFIVDGSCAWQVAVYASEPAPSSSPSPSNSLESDPRM
jgi:hypothetical protein